MILAYLNIKTFLGRHGNLLSSLIFLFKVHKFEFDLNFLLPNLNIAFYVRIALHKGVGNNPIEPSGLARDYISLIHPSYTFKKGIKLKKSLTLLYINL